MKQQALLADNEIIVGHVILEPGEKRAPEVHAAMSETIVVLRGKIAIEMCGKRVVASAGVELDDIEEPDLRFHLAPLIDAVEHAVSNASATEPAEFIAIMRRVEDNK